MTPLSIAIQGIGFVPLLVALQGFGFVERTDDGGRPSDATIPMRALVAQDRRRREDEELLLILAAAMHVLQ